MEHKTIHLKDHYPFLGTDGKDPTLEIFLPLNLSEMGWQDLRHPCVLVLPGGGYFYCSAREAEPVALQFLPLAYNVFVLNYSTKGHHFPSQLIEIAAVLDLIHQNADMWHCDVNRIAVVGFSAGGHLAAHYSNAYDCPQVRAVFPGSKPVHATILGYPVITGDLSITHQGSIINISGSKVPTKQEQDFFSCHKMVTSQTPPAFLWHTAEDDTSPVQNSLLYASALAAHHIPFELHVYPHGRHGLSTADGHTCEPLIPAAHRVHGWIQAAQHWLGILFNWPNSENK